MIRQPAGSRAALAIAWEELAASRAPRFREGERVLVALTPLPSASIWLSRFPDPEVRSRVRGVAMRASAFLRDPSLRSIDRLNHYLAMAGEARRGQPGTEILVDLVAAAEPPLALDAVRLLTQRSELEHLLPAPTAQRLASCKSSMETIRKQRRPRWHP